MADDKPEISPEQLAAMERFVAQSEGRARRSYPQGRLGANDEGALVAAVGVDKEKRCLIIDFGKPVTWVALRAPGIHQLITALTTKLAELESL